MRFGCFFGVSFRTQGKGDPPSDEDRNVSRTSFFCDEVDKTTVDVQEIQIRVSIILVGARIFLPSTGGVWDVMSVYCKSFGMTINCFLYSEIGLDQ